MINYKRVENFGNKIVPNPITGPCKYAVSFLRYAEKLRIAKKEYQIHGDAYSNHILFVAGLPKSGTTWLENMLASYPGYTKNMLPEVIKFEYKNRGTHFLEIRKEWFRELSETLTVLKLHCYGSLNNKLILQELNLPYIIIFRDLRDVAVSHTFYVKNTWHHPEHSDYKDLSIQEGLEHFSRTLLPGFKKWIYSWFEEENNTHSLFIRYEDLKNQTFEIMKKVVAHYDLPDDNQLLKEIIESNSFKAKTGGRERGEENSSSFYRKGSSGDWKNHFTNELKEKFKKEIGKLLIELNYESDYNW
ncbi:MAG: sulfotransferase domain-containing protein [Balneolaceae bacterium]|nr:sulfotransferase domain-containing protein [Balneolaceae bacterium]